MAAQCLPHPGQPGAVIVGATVSATLVPVLQIDLDHLQERHPKATREQLVDELLALGILQYHRNHNLPRPGSNPDTDG